MQQLNVLQRIGRSRIRTAASLRCTICSDFAHRKFALHLTVGEDADQPHEAWTHLDVDRKAEDHVETELALAQQYYEKAIDLWPENCGALAYESELYLQKGELSTSWNKLKGLCENYVCGDSHQAIETVSMFLAAGARLPDACVLNALPSPEEGGGGGGGGGMMSSDAAPENTLLLSVVVSGVFVMFLVSDSVVYTGF